MATTGMVGEPAGCSQAERRAGILNIRAEPVHNQKQDNGRQAWYGISC